MRLRFVYPLAAAKFALLECSDEDTLRGHRSDMNDDALAPLFPDIHPAERSRFLAARDGNLEQAVEMLQRHLVWRSAHESALANLKEPPPLIGSTLCAMGLNTLIAKLPARPLSTPEHPPWRRPEFAWAGGTAVDGSRCVCLMCCLIDLKLVKLYTFIPGKFQVYAPEARGRTTYCSEWAGGY